MASRVRRIVTKILNILVPLFDLNNEQDELYLTAGEHVITVETRSEPKEVWFKFLDTGSEAMPVCHGDIDTLGYTILPNGFILYAHIASNLRGMRWFASLLEPGEPRPAPTDPTEPPLEMVGLETMDDLQDVTEHVVIKETIVAAALNPGKGNKK